MTLKGVDDATQFSAVQKAFDTIGMDELAQLQVGSRKPKSICIIPI